MHSRMRAAAAGAMGHHDPLVPGMSPLATRVLAVGGDASRLGRLVTNLSLRGYQAVTSSIDPAAAMAGLRQDGLRSFDVVMVDTYSQYAARGAAFQLFKFAVLDPLLCVYAVPEDGKPVGPLEMMDLDISKKHEYDVTSVVQKSSQVTPDDPCNTSPSTTVSTITNTPSSGGKARGNISKHIHDTSTQEVEQDREHIEKEEQPVEKAKKPRIVWTDELHNKFVEAYNKLDITGDAVPKKILALMNDDRLTRENIASHLQKYRLHLERDGCTNSLRMSPSRTQHDRSTPQASFPSPNMSSQQQALSTSMQSQPEKVYDDHRVNHVQTLNTMEKSNKLVLVDVSSKRMHPRANDRKQDSVCGVGNSDDDILDEDISAILNNDPGPSLQEQLSLANLLESLSSFQKCR